MITKCKEKVPVEIRLYFETLLNLLLTHAEKDYHNPLLSFQNYKEQLKRQIYEQAAQLHHKMKRAEEILKTHLDAEEKSNKQIPLESTFRYWHEGYKKLHDLVRDAEASKKEIFVALLLQTLCHATWGFMDRANRVVLEIDHRLHDIWIHDLRRSSNQHSDR